MNKTQIIIGIIVIALIASYLVLRWSGENTAGTEESALPDIADIGSAVPDINPVSQTNPFSNIKTNPFE